MNEFETPHEFNESDLEKIHHDIDYNLRLTSSSSMNTCITCNSLINDTWKSIIILYLNQTINYYSRNWDCRKIQMIWGRFSLMWFQIKHWNMFHMVVKLYWSNKNPNKWPKTQTKSYYDYPVFVTCLTPNNDLIWWSTSRFVYFIICHLPFSFFPSFLEIFQWMNRKQIRISILSSNLCKPINI